MKKQVDPFKKLKLDAEEQKISDAIERGEFESVGDLKERKKELAQHAAYTLRDKKAERINIRISENDLNQIQAKAVENGLPYQTLITTILHQYAKDKLKISL